MSSETGGQFVWRDLMTTDAATAKAFYTELFGWTTNPMPIDGHGTYEMLFNGAHSFGGIVQLDPDHGIPSHWVSYIYTQGTVDEACARVTELGGSVVVQPMDIPNVGRFAVAMDPQGAVFSPFTASEEYAGQTPVVPPVGTSGGIAWNELATGDVDGAISFYGRLFGWENRVMDVGTVPYNIMQRGEAQECGIFQKPDEMPVSAWVIYFEAAGSLDATLERATQLGGQPVGPVIDVPSVGRLSWAMDPTGGMFAIMQSLVPAVV